MVKEIKEAKNTTVEFAVKMGGVVVWLTMLALGVYSIFLGLEKIGLQVCAWSAVFAGALNVIVSFFVLYKVLMKEA